MPTDGPSAPLPRGLSAPRSRRTNFSDRKSSLAVPLKRLSIASAHAVNKYRQQTTSSSFKALPAFCWQRSPCWRQTVWVWRTRDKTPPSEARSIGAQSWIIYRMTNATKVASLPSTAAYDRWRCWVARCHGNVRPPPRQGRRPRARRTASSQQHRFQIRTTSCFCANVQQLAATWTTATSRLGRSVIISRACASCLRRTRVGLKNAKHEVYELDNNNETWTLLKKRRIVVHRH